jgi:hypothetical protein
MMNLYLYNNIINISYAFIIGGLIVVLLTVGTHNQNALIGTITGYAAATCATLLLAGLTYTTITTSYKKPSWSSILTTLIPFMILCMIFGFSLALVSVYFDEIASNRVSDYYGLFSYISVIFIFLQVGLFFSASQQKAFRENGYIDKITLLQLLLLAIFNILALITLGISLKYFSTDG